MGTDNEVIGSNCRTKGMRMGLISVMAATGMVLAGQAAEATTTAAPSPKTQADDTGQGHANGGGQRQANGGGQGLPLHLPRLAGGNSGASCIATDPLVCVGTTMADAGSVTDSGSVSSVPTCSAVS